MFLQLFTNLGYFYPDGLLIGWRWTNKPQFRQGLINARKKNINRRQQQQNPIKRQQLLYFIWMIYNGYKLVKITTEINQTEIYVKEIHCIKSVKHNKSAYMLLYTHYQPNISVDHKFQHGAITSFNKLCRKNISHATTKHFCFDYCNSKYTEFNKSLRWFFKTKCGVVHVAKQYSNLIIQSQL